MRTTRRPFLAAAIGIAALALTLSGCGDGKADDDTAEPTGSAPSEDATSSRGGGGGMGYAPVGEFPVLSLAPMATDDDPSSTVSSDRLAEIAAGIAGAEPEDVTCEGVLTGGSSSPVSCTVTSTQEEITGYPVLSGLSGDEDYSLVVAGQLAEAQAEMVMDPEVSVHYGPTSLFFDDPALLEQEGLVDRVQAELGSLGLTDSVTACEGIVGESSGHSGVRCTGVQTDSPAPFEAQLYPTLSASGDPVTFALIHRPLQ